MGEMLEITIRRWYDDGERETYQDLVALKAPREVLARFASGVVADALGVNTSALVHTAVAIDTASGQPTGAPDGIAFREEPAGTSTKRKRRTKAEMEADRLAEQTSAEEAVTNAGPDPYQPGDPILVTMDNRSGTFTPVESVPDAPFNPFAPK